MAAFSIKKQFIIPEIEFHGSRSVMRIIRNVNGRKIAAVPFGVDN
jgi:hypothetical protein